MVNTRNYLKEAIVVLHYSLKGYKVISKQFEIHHFTPGKIIHKWKTFKIAANLLRSGHPFKFTLRSDCEIFRGIARNPRAMSWSLQVSWHVNDLNKYGLFGKVARRKSFGLKKKYMATWIRFAKLHLNKSHKFWKIILWTDVLYLKLIMSSFVYQSNSGVRCDLSHSLQTWAKISS
uniref:Uncharacterized protein n=1 Tax=Pundamilia nyererei TaxID=303518 RepID=A0A3B4H0G6_9CICH